jgi:hypothetical protein
MAQYMAGAGECLFVLFSLQTPLWTIQIHVRRVQKAFLSPKLHGVHSTSITIIIQFNSIHVYLRASSTAQRPIRELARVKEGKQEIIQTNNKIYNKN